jgi:aminoglycoside phosphotransferase (APT) family kinase protein
VARRGADYIGTMEVQEKHRFDERSLARFMAVHVEGFVPPVKAEQFKGGQSNPTYQLLTANRNYVLRRKPPGPLLPSAHAVDREYKVIKALSDVGFPVPKPFALCTDDSVIGTMFYVMEMVEGRVFWEMDLPGMTPAERSAVYDAKITALAKLQAIDYKAVGLEDFGKPTDYFARQITRWSKNYIASETVKIPVMDRLNEWLPKNVPSDDAVSIVHGDYRMDNMIFHPTEPRVVAVLDWELSTIGDPLAELSYLCMLWRTPRDWGGLKGHDLASLGLPGEQEMVAYYCELSGRALPDPALWEFYMAYNLFRVSCIRQGVYARALDGTASNLRAAESGKLVRPAADLAWSIVEGMAGGGR